MMALLSCSGRERVTVTGLEIASGRVHDSRLTLIDLFELQAGTVERERVLRGARDAIEDRRYQVL